MKIAVDLQGLQSTGSRNRGIGRYVQSLLEELFALRSRHGFCLIANGTLPPPEFKHPDNLRIHTVPLPVPGGGSYNELLMRATLLGADVDACFLPSPMELMDTAVPDLADFPGTVCAICYDLVPYLYADRYLSDPGLRALYTRRLRNVRNADYLFAISESTRTDAIRHLGLPPERVFNIGAGVSSFFRPEPEGDALVWRTAFEKKFGITRPFVLYTGGEDWRKNIPGLIDAFAMLPAPLRNDYQMVVACKLADHTAGILRLRAHDAGLPSDAVVLTGYVSDEELRAFYSLCELFVFPSLYEGFGLPIVEAMACGAPAITGDNSSLREIVTEPALLFDSLSPASIAQRLGAVLVDNALRTRLRAEAPDTAAHYTWTAVARKVHDILENVPGRPKSTFTLSRYRVDPVDGKQVLAFFSPFRPLETGVSDYSEEILAPLLDFYDADLYTDDGYSPVLGTNQGWKVNRYPAFESVVAMRRRDYHGLIYQMGNSIHHGFMYGLMRRYAGITVLHDYALGAMIDHVQRARPDFGIRLLDEFTHAYGPERASEIVGDLTRGACTPNELPARGIYANRRIFSRSLGVIVHNKWSCDRAMVDHGDIEPLVAYIPAVVPLVPLEVDPDEVQGLRRKWDVPEDAFVFAPCGIVAESKRPYAILDAFRHVLPKYPKAFLLFVGPDSMQGDFRAQIAKRGLADRVRVTGFVDIPTFNDLLRLVDVCITLRYPSNGETSGALIRMLAHGKPSIVTDIGSFGEFPDDTVHKLPTPDRGDEVAHLVAAFELLASDADYREGLGRRAAEYMRREHSPERCARLYHDFIESVLSDPRTRQRLLADSVAREIAKIDDQGDPAALLTPFESIFEG